MLAAVNLWLNAPMFRAGETPYRGSIGAGYAAIARFITENPNMWGWNPYYYGGLPTQFTYLPGVNYSTALVSWITGLDPVNVYRWLMAAMACLGPVTLFFFAYYFTRSRWWAFLTALSYSLFSPSYGLFTAVLQDQGILPIPWRLQVLVKYGEGPHNFGLTLLPLAVMAVWRAGVRHTYPALLLAAVLLAGVALTHWIAALALALVCGILLLAVMGNARALGFELWRPVAAAALGYLLASFWLTPSFIQTVAFNWPADAFNYKLQLKQMVLLAALPLLAVAARAAFGRDPGRVYLCLVTLSFAAFTVIVEGFYGYGVNTIPESRRYALEFEMFLFLAVFEWLRRAWSSGNRINQGCAAAAGLLLLWAGAAEAKQYVAAGWKQWKVEPRERSVEHRILQTLEGLSPRGRIYASGGVRFRINTYTNLQQVGGTFESGLQNRFFHLMLEQVRVAFPGDLATSGRYAVKQLRAIGVEYLVVNGPGSQEYYRDIKRQDRFPGLLPEVWREGDDAIYRVPFRSIAHAVRDAEMPLGEHPTLLDRYDAVLDDRALAFAWRSPSALTVWGAVPEGTRVVIQMNHEPGWKAWQDGQPVPVRSNAVGYLVADVQPKPATRVELRYEGTAEQKSMAAVSGLAWLAALGALVRAWRKGSGA